MATLKGPTIKERFKLGRGSPIGFFNPVIPRVISGTHLPRILSIPNPELQIREIPDTEKLIVDPLRYVTLAMCSLFKKLKRGLASEFQK